VILVRHHNGSVRVLLNRCTHRGVKLLAERSGNRPRLVCLYHGWTFDTDSTLTRVPVDEGCAQGFRACDFNLATAARTGACWPRLVFASLAPKGPGLPSFEEWIEPMKRNIDDIVDRAPAGEIALDVGVHRYRVRQLEMQVENVIDSYHVPFSHASTVNRKGVQFSRREQRRGCEGGGGPAHRRELEAAARPRRGWGHGWTSNTELDEGSRASPT
jgi:phenylpropionate dioxygenase-like ring-hydroxylating dioxygenase large terminal subunit